MRCTVRWMGLLLLALLWVGGVSNPTRAHAAGPAPQTPATQKPTAQPTAPPTRPAATTPEGKPPPAPEANAAAGSGAKPPATGGSGVDPFAGGTPDVRQSEIYGDRLDGLQSDVDELKDKIFRSKARLSLLKETVLRGVLAGSRVILAHRNLMGSGFRLVRVVYTLDGAQIYARTDETGGLDSEDELTIYDGNLPPGPHTVTVELEYRGHGYGIFSYVNQYTFNSKGEWSFTAPENGAIKLTSAGYESGNITTEMRDRPQVQWQELPLDASGRPLPTTRKRTRTTRRK